MNDRRCHRIISASFPLLLALSGTAQHAVAPDAAFVPNLGQWTHPASYAARFGAITAFAEAGAVVIAVDPGGEATRRAAFRLSFGGGAPEPGARLAGHVDFFLGDDPARWRTEVPRYGRLVWRNVAPGIDVVARGHDGLFEYDVELEPGADLALFSVHVEGATVRSGENGALVLDTGVGPVFHTAPVAWTVGADGGRLPIDCRAEPRGAGIGFAVSDWDGSSKLVIDPGLVYSSPIGGSGYDQARALHVGDDGVITTAGFTFSPNYPVTVGTSAASSNNREATVTRLDPDLPPAQQLLWSVVFGGSAGDYVNDLHVEPSGAVLVVGVTESADFPVAGTGPFSSPRGGPVDAFLARIDPALPGPSQLTLTSVIGGTASDRNKALHVDDATGLVTVAGTSTGGIPITPNGIPAPGYSDAFVLQYQMDPSGTSAGIVYGTYFGSGGNDGFVDVHVDAAGRITAVGDAAGSIPTTANAFVATRVGYGQRGIVVQLVPGATATTVSFASYTSTSHSDVRAGLHVADDGILTIAGTESLVRPLTQRIDPTAPSSLLFEHRIPLNGQNGQSDVYGLDVDELGRILIVGNTWATNFPVSAGAPQTTNLGNRDLFLARIDPSLPAGAELDVGLLLGSTGFDIALDVQSVGVNRVVVAGGVSNGYPGFPTTPNAFSGLMGGQDAWVGIIDLLTPGTGTFGASTPGCGGPLAIGTQSQPQVGNTEFGLVCTNPPASGFGIVAFAPPLAVPVSLAGLDFWVDPQAVWGVPSASIDGSVGRMPMPIPPDPIYAGAILTAQFLWSDSAPPCPSTGLSASNAIQFMVMP